MNRSFKILIAIIALILLFLLISITAGARIYTDILWFKSLDYLHTFLVMFLTNTGIRLVIGVIFAVFIFINLNFTKKPLLDYININKNENVETLFGGDKNNLLKWLNSKRLTLIYSLASIVLGFLFSSISQNVWKIVLKYLNRTPFGMMDPIFSRDIGFYVFTLPFYNFIKEMSMVLVILTLIVVGIIYILVSGINSFKEMGVKLSTRAKSHAILLIAAFLFLKAWDYRLQMYDLLYSSRGVVFGASYTDVHANLLGLKILLFIAIAIGVILLSSLFRKNYKILVWGLGLWLLASFVFGSVYPGLVQRFQVEPNEIAKESKYINYNIDMTLKAYGLNKIKTTKFEVKNNLSLDDLDGNSETISNIRLWDSRPLLSTYSQLQELRQYYNFINVDIDRYNINGDYRQVMLAGREMDQTLLSGQAKTWINQTLKYTHGYGLVMSPVNKITPEGLPEFFIKDIPPKTNVDIDIENSSIYYGEKTDNYVITNSRSKEFHYPMGSKNVYTNYDGNGGIQLTNIWRKLLYTIKYSNIKFLLADDISKESRIMYYRNINQRVRKVAPFLQYDRDPYLVLANGHLYWIQDAYTTSELYPYSSPVRNVGNYIRNSIKVVIDAYNGDMDYYVIDKEDPLAKTYMKIFPDLFVDADNMPAEIKKHIRYPKDLFVIQSQLFSTYHMKDPTVFYNKEDLWNIPTENYAGNSIQMQPYYIISKLPDYDKSEFILMLPFTPATKNNMISWMAARSDGDKYGELVIYKFPKDKLVYGPMQIESRIDQDSDISQLLTLWSQRGSRVIRGNLLVIPVENSILYIEPIYIQAETSELPELKRVVVAFGNKIVMKEGLDQALTEIFGKEMPVVEKISEINEEIILSESVKDLSESAVNIYRQAQESLKDGNWSKYGEQIKQLEDILIKLKNVINK